MAEARERPLVNRASREELIEAGVLPVVADRIMAYRAKHGAFRDENELYLVVRDKPMRWDQLVGVVRFDDEDGLRQGYST